MPNLGISYGGNVLKVGILLDSAYVFSSLVAILRSSGWLYGY